ncbi:nose resistant to fluoxetine protein 6 [Ixodes scapularis]|uniref:nose resistant to fluoxetine protein 6 n=1 Tax=Ixodes scapularis TaxID=6945 RepID=UPI001A9F5F61|nr:nose resistant to fluoxetine protein 6 [Ixodes scapularis]
MRTCLLGFLVTAALAAAQQVAESSSSPLSAATDTGRQQDRAQVEQQWSQMEKALRTAAESAVGKVFPTLVKASSEAEVSGDCQAALLKVILGVRRLKDWAIRLVDSSGKLPMGIMTGSVAALGAYDQCLSVHYDDDTHDPIVGRYCTLNIQFPYLPRTFKNSSEIIKEKDSFMHWVYNYGKWMKYFPIRIGICLPSHCVKEDLEKLGKYIVKPVNMKSWVGTCEGKTPTKITTLQVVVLSILGALLVLVFLGTCIDRMCGPKKAEKPNSQSGHLGLATKMLASFSFVANTRKLLYPRRSRDTLCVLHGIRVLSCLWIILGHTYFLADIVSFIRFKRLKTLEDLNTDVAFTAIENFLPVDTFFFISGLLIVYSNWGRLEKKKGKLNVLSAFLQRFWRMTPSYMLVVGVFLLLPLVGSGPLWKETMDPLLENCMQSWWTNLLYVSNYLPYDKMCLLHTWFQAVNMQFFIIALPLLLFVYKCRVLGLTLVVSLCLISTLAVGLITYFFQLPPALLLSTSEWSKAVQHLNLIYFQPFTHFGPFCVGLFCGYYLIQNKGITLKPTTLVVGWLSALVCALVALLGAYPFRAGYDVDSVLMAFYAAMHRTVWCVAVAWLTVACELGHGGLLNETLSWRGLVPLSTLSYLIYLIHPLVVYVHVATTREIVNLDHFTMCYSFLGHATISVGLAYVAHVVVELPFASLKDIVWRRSSSTTTTDPRQCCPTLGAKGPELHTVCVPGLNGAVRQQPLDLGLPTRA